MTQSVLSQATSVRTALNVLAIEAKAIAQLKHAIDQSFESLCQHIMRCDGRVIVIGMGKSGHIGKKIAATLISINKLALVKDMSIPAIFISGPIL